MRCGSKNAKDEITTKDMPMALATVLTLKKDQFKIHELFDKHDADASGCLPREELSPLLSEINDGVQPTDKDIDYILAKCDLDGNGRIERDQVKAAIECWYVLCEERPLPSSVEEAKAMGYSDEEIASYQADLAAEMEAQAAAAAVAAEAVPPAEEAAAAAPAAEAAAAPVAEAAAAPVAEAAAAPAAEAAAAPAAEAAAAPAAVAAPAAEVAAAPAAEAAP